MVKKGIKGLNMILVFGGLLLGVLFFLMAYNMKEGFSVTPSTEEGTCSDSGEKKTCVWNISSTAPTKEKALTDLRGSCSASGKYTTASVTDISTVTENANGTYTVTAKCSRSYVPLTTTH